MRYRCKSILSLEVPYSEPNTRCLLLQFIVFYSLAFSVNCVIQCTFIQTNAIPMDPPCIYTSYLAKFRTELLSCISSCSPPDGVCPQGNLQCCVQVSQATSFNMQQVTQGLGFTLSPDSVTQTSFGG